MQRTSFYDLKHGFESYTSRLVLLLLNKYSGCTNISGAKEYCAICRIEVDFNNIKRICDFAQFKFHELLKIWDQLRPLVREAMDYGPKDC